MAAALPRIAVAFGAALVAYANPGADAHGSAAVVVELVGDANVNVRIAPSTHDSAISCDGTSLGWIFRGILAPGASRTLATDAACICVEQTFAPRLTSGWSSPQRWCRSDGATPIRVRLSARDR